MKSSLVGELSSSSFTCESEIVGQNREEICQEVPLKIDLCNKITSIFFRSCRNIFSPNNIVNFNSSHQVPSSIPTCSWRKKIPFSIWERVELASNLCKIMEEKKHAQKEFPRVKINIMEIFHECFFFASS